MPLPFSPRCGAIFPVVNLKSLNQKNETDLCLVYIFLCILYVWCISLVCWSFCNCVRSSPAPNLTITPAEDRWVACDRCSKWRRITDEKMAVPEGTWFCELTDGSAHNSCDAVEEPSSPDAIAAANQQQQAVWAAQQQMALSNPFAAANFQQQEGGWFERS